MVVKTLLYCTRKCGCEGGVVSASCRLQPDRQGSTGQVPLLEKETFSRFVLGTPRACKRCSWDGPRESFMFQMGPDQLNRCEVTANSNLLLDTTPRSQPHFLVQYNRVFTTM